MLIETGLNLLVPIGDLLLILLLNDILGGQGHNLLEANHKHIGLIALVKWDQPLGDIRLF
jgi:hypothetical protein